MASEVPRVDGCSNFSSFLYVLNNKKKMLAFVMFVSVKVILLKVRPKFAASVAPQLVPATSESKTSQQKRHKTARKYRGDRRKTTRLKWKELVTVNTCASNVAK